MDRRQWKLITPKTISEDSIREYCRQCIEETKRLNKPSSKAMDCWKIVYVTDDPEELSKVVRVVEKIIEKSGECWAEYREPDIYTGSEGSVIIICKGWRNMWALREDLIKTLIDIGVLTKYYIPYRRGGNYYDKYFGPWRLWALRYYPERLPIRELASAKAICPNDGTPMDFEKKGLLCGLCNLYIPETTLFEAIENGEADLRIKQGFHKDEVYRVKYFGGERFIVSRLDAKRVSK
ncbi:MAG: hypothetical protein DRO40_01140 [Thermoprotei archaeon]|nr:MAG: hypothetical protein DRO40_01140 [Thermoprotei archaeon]